MKRLAIVTGASSGIGRATALLLAKGGVDVVIAARRLSALDDVAKEIGWSGGSAHVRACDVTDRQSCEDLVAYARLLAADSYPVLVNNAGTAQFGAFHDTPVEDIENQIQANLMGPVYLCHAAIPWMLSSGGGQIVNVSSVVARQVFPGTAAYSVAKTGLAVLGRVLAAEYRRQGIRVTNVVAGAVDSPIWDGSNSELDRTKMLSVEAVAEAIRDVVVAPLDRNFDEIQLMPPDGVL